MGKIAEYANDWLVECGYELGYDYNSLPNMGECERIRKKYRSGYNFKSIGRIIKENGMNKKEYWEDKQ